MGLARREALKFIEQEAGLNKARWVGRALAV